MRKRKVEQYYRSNNSPKKKLQCSIRGLKYSIILRIKCQRKKKQLPWTPSALGRTVNFTAAAITTLLCPSHPLAPTAKTRLEIQDFVILAGREALVI